MTAPDPADTVIEPSRAANEVERIIEDFIAADPADRDEPCQWKVAADALADYGEQALARAERAEAELEAWRSGRRRKSWPTIESVPDGLHYAAELVRAQGTEGGDAHDELLRQAAMRLKELHDLAPVLLAEKERAEAEVAELRAMRDRVRALAEAWTSERDELHPRWAEAGSDLRAALDGAGEQCTECAEAEVARLRKLVEELGGTA